MKTKQLQTEWKEKNISDFAEVITGGTPSTTKKEYWENGTIPWLPSGKCQNCEIISAEKFITKEGLKNSAARMMPKETVVMALTGATTGKIGILKIEASANQSVTGILPSEEHLPKFLFYYLRTIRNKILAQAYGGAQPHISQEFVKKLKIPLPPLSTQKAIVKILEQAEQLKQKREQADKLMDDYLKSVFHEMFMGKGFPEEEIYNLILKTENRNPAKEFPKNYFEYIDIASIENEIKKIISTKKILGEDAPSRAKQLVKYGDLLVSTVRPNLNAIALVPEKLDNQICSTGFCILRANNKKALSEYLFFISQSQFFVNSLVEKCKGANYPAVSNKDIASLKIPLPPLALQKKFASIVEKVEKIKEAQKKSKQEIDDLFNTLMQKAFKGELVK